MTIRREQHACRLMAELGLRPATPWDIDEGRAMAAALVGPDIATPADLARVQAATGCAVFAMRSREGRLIGALSVIPLGAGARRSLAAGRFDGRAPPDEALARPGQPAVAFYGWGMAGVTARARAAVIAGALRLQREVYGDLPFYARAATSQGEHILHRRMGARPLPGSDGLVAAPPWSSTLRRAA